MELINVTPFPAAYTMATDKTGREWIVLVAKASYSFPDYPGAAPALLDQQLPLIMADVFTGDPASSAPLYENDFALRKPRCDIVLNGSCYAPRGTPSGTVPVGLRVGRVVKAFAVVGPRRWKAGALLGVTPSVPDPFAVMPISYANAYGGVDRPRPDPATHRWYASNPVGLGFRPGTPARQLVGQPLPNTEEINRHVDRCDGDYVPMALGPIGRAWEQRIRFAGTYDDIWQREQYPFLPLDFDERYFQCVPEDQQCEHLQGGEEVVLLNLTPAGHTEFKLPRLAEPFDVCYRNGERKRLYGVVDTLLMEPDHGRFSLNLRVSFQLRRSVHEVRAIEFGRVLPQPLPPEGEAQIYAAKRRVPLAQLVAERRAARSVRRDGT